MFSLRFVNNQEPRSEKTLWHELQLQMHRPMCWRSAEEPPCSVFEPWLLSEHVTLWATVRYIRWEPWLLSEHVTLWATVCYIRWLLSEHATLWPTVCYIRWEPWLLSEHATLWATLHGHTNCGLSDQQNCRRSDDYTAVAVNRFLQLIFLKTLLNGLSLWYRYWKSINFFKILVSLCSFMIIIILFWKEIVSWKRMFSSLIWDFFYIFLSTAKFSYEFQVNILLSLHVKCPINEKNPFVIGYTF